MNFKQEKLLVAILLGFIYFIGNGQLPVTDPVESNYTLTAYEMLEAHDWLSPRIYGRFWFDKPVFFYWELMTAFSIFGVNDFAARFFPALFALANLGLAYFFGRKLYGEKQGMLAAIMLGTSLLFWYIGKAIITDMAFVFFFNAVLVTFYLGFSQGKRRLYLLTFFFSGLAVLTKGPVGFLLPGLIILVFLILRRHYREILHLNWLPGLTIFVLVGCSWYWLMYQAHGQAFLDGFLGVHNYLRATVSEHPRDNVWYYYTVIFLLGFFPWSFAGLYYLKKHWTKLKEEGMNDNTAFLLLWAGIVNIFFQMMATKYGTYTLPSFLPIALLAAKVMAEHGKFVYRLAAGVGIVYVILVFKLAMPLCELKSGQKMAEYLVTLRQDDLIYCAGDYRASEVYYSGHMIIDLAPQAAIDELKKGGINWNAKKVMPFQAIETLPYNKKFYVIYDTKNKWQVDSLLKRAKCLSQQEIGKRTILCLELLPKKG